MYKQIILVLITVYVYQVEGQEDINDHFFKGRYPKKPEKCFGTDDLLDPYCCILPPFYMYDVARGCGAIFELMSSDRQYNVSIFRRNAITQCEHWRCILKEYGLLDPDDTLNEENFYLHLDKWIALNPEFSVIMLKSKRECKIIYGVQMPLKACEYFRFHQCIRQSIILDCPKTIPSEICEEQKTFYDECRQYF